jgi:hypothetical protein
MELSDRPARPNTQAIRADFEHVQGFVAREARIAPD